MFRAIVVGTDGSEAAQAALAEAIDLARGSAAKLCVVSAYEPIPAAPLRDEPCQVARDPQWILNVQADASETLDAAADAVRAAGVGVETFAREGDPADAILDVAEERDADLIVIGHKGRTGASRFLLGSVPNKISHHAPCSVLIVRA